MSRCCNICGGTGLKTVHRQGDVVQGAVNNEYCKTIYTSTVYETCECCIIKSKRLAEEDDDL